MIAFFTKHLFFFIAVFFLPPFLGFKHAVVHRFFHAQLVFAVTMNAAALIGDQLILEEDYDENYIPSDQGRLQSSTRHIKGTDTRVADT